MELLLSLKDKVFIQGNHDEWCHNWLKGNAATMNWLHQGGIATFEAYKKLSLSDQRRHKELYFDLMVPYYEQDNCLFVHGGYNWKFPVAEQPVSLLCWDRDLWQTAANHNFVVKDYKEVFIGHTTTTRTSTVPENRANVWNLDQGAGWEGKLSVMNVETKEFWQSDVVKTLYPGVKGR